MGKTTLCRSLVQEIDRRTVTSLVLEPLQSIDDLLKTMLVDFGVIAREDLAGAAHLSRERLTGTLNAFLESLVPLNASAVVFVDEAQNLPVALLGDLAALLGGPAARVLQLVLVGQPALTALLKHADLRALNASVARRTELGPLGADEISGYVMHRLSIAGAHTRIEFNDAAIARLYELSAGSPRVVNLLCDRALTRGQAASAGVIDLGLIEEGGGRSRSRRARRRSSRRARLGAARRPLRAAGAGRRGRRALGVARRREPDDAPVGEHPAPARRTHPPPAGADRADPAATGFQITNFQISDCGFNLKSET